MASDVGICNLALGRIAQRAIASLSERSNEAMFCTTFYDSVRRIVLRAYPWNFARKVAALALSAEDAEYGYVYRYALPTDCLRPLELTNLEHGGRERLFSNGPPARRIAFRIMGRDLLANMENARLAYTRNVEDPNLFDDLFSEAFSYRLAADLAGVLPESANFQKNMIQLYQQTLAGAKSVDASINRTDDRPTILSVRF
ncbi:MAG: hypothetical protein AB7D47_13190 [Desulfovibrio sp.]